MATQQSQFSLSTPRSCRPTSYYDRL